jgi:transcriptional regulator with XRE-family HTH domain
MTVSQQRPGEADIAKRFGANLRSARLGRGLTQATLAERSGVTPGLIHLVEYGESLPRAESVVRLAGGLGVEIADLTKGLDWEPAVGDIGGHFVVFGGDPGT